MLLQAKICTIEKVLTTLELIFTREGMLSQHGVRLTSQLAKLLTHRSVQGVRSNGERDDSSSRENEDSSNGEREREREREREDSSRERKRTVAMERERIVAVDS